jgi:hypothetical protein
MLVRKMSELVKGVFPLFVCGFIRGHGGSEELMIGGSDELGVGNFRVFERDFSSSGAAD